MPIGHTLLTSGVDGTDATSYTTASITPGANNLILVDVFTHNADTPTLSGNGLTYVLVDSRVDVFSVFVFRAMGAAPSTGAITIDFGAATQNRCGWIVSQLDTVDTEGANGSGAVVQSASNAASVVSSLTVTLADFANTNNATYGAFVATSAAVGIAPGTGFTQIADQQLEATFSTHMFAEWRNDNDTSVDASTEDVSNTSWRGVALEIAIFVPVSGGLPILHLLRRR